MADIESRMTEVEKRQAVSDAKFDAFLTEMRDFKAEMRQQNEMRAKEIADLRKAQAEQQEKHDKKMDKLLERFDKTSNEVRQEVHNLFLTAVVGVAAIVITVIASMVYTAVQLNKPQQTVESIPDPTPAVHIQLEHSNPLPESTE